MRIITEGVLQDAPIAIKKVFKPLMAKYAKQGYDLAKAKFTLMPIPTSGNAKIFKDSEIVPCFYLDFKLNNTNPWAKTKGWFIKGIEADHTFIDSKYVDINKMSISRLLQFCTNFGIIDLREAKSDDILALRAKRRELKDPDARDREKSQHYYTRYDRFGPNGEWLEQPRIVTRIAEPPRGYDKSGYKIPDDKYRKLADTVTPQTIVHKLTIWYVKLNKLQMRVNEAVSRLSIEQALKMSPWSDNGFSRMSDIFLYLGRAITTYNNLDELVKTYLEGESEDTPFRYISDKFSYESKSIREHIKYVENKLQKFEASI